jgi:hypothetical protein
MVQCWPRPVDYSVVRRFHIVTTECLHSGERYAKEELINDETSVGGLIDLLPPDGTELAAQTGNLPISPVRWAIELASPEMSALRVHTLVSSTGHPNGVATPLLSPLAT